MEKKYAICISIFIVSILILSILSFSFIIDNIFINNQENNQNDSLEVYILPSLSEGNAPLNVEFKSLVKNSIDEVTYLWDFGDGTTSYEKSPNHSYNLKGTYNISLTVKDSVDEFSDEIVITVLENNPPFIKIIVDKTSGNRPLTVNFDVDGFDTDGEIVSYEWEIKYPPFFSYQKISNHNGKNFSEKFLRSGFYEVELIVEDDFGNIATDYIKIQVLGHQIELLVGTTLYYIGIFDTIFKIYNNFIDKITVSPPQPFAEKLISFWR